MTDGRWRSVDVFVDDSVVLGVDDDVVADGRGGDGHGGADGRQRVVRGSGGGGCGAGVLLVVVASGH